MTDLPLNALLSLLTAVVAAGLFGGLVAGLFGVGGGTVLVPVLFYAFATLQLGGEGNLHVAVGTSLLTIVATSWRSLKAHRTHGAVDEAVLKAWTPWIAAGALAGAAVAGFTSMGGLAIVYGLCLGIVAAQMGLLPERATLASDLPVGWMRRILGSLIGGLSAMMGVGGGSLGGMMMVLCGRPTHQAIATASGFGIAIGLAAMVGFIVFGWQAPGRPPLSLGYVNVPAAVVMGILTTLVAPWGAKLAHSLDRRVLRKAFALYLVCAAGLVVFKAI